ncbi:short-chain collagen C4-like [Mizuhopecten yessoensis]|uniref:Short-chain collagen C4 n=1 Tax=Mizuhopecten yessoensis TaxID=6573 RepID=A0A210Q3T3_MIZYE|nr:short-chain collagen C4-like [Mizuhopecten yessoensis]OWF43403.1 Short-chain collagen C4 [Mizuhopecten yessoensis]
MFSAYVYFVGLLCWVLCSNSALEIHRHRRILLSDPNYLQNELHEIQVKLQEYEVVKSQVDTLQSEVDTLKSTNQQLEQQLPKIATRGTVYVRWGRTDCPGNGTELVYTGYAGGSWYDHYGAAAEYTCLPADPIWGPNKDIRSYYPALMYGAEYEDTLLFNVPNTYEDVPCAVCRSSTHSTSIMIPARTQCYSGWDKAYVGDLAGGYYDSKAATQYVCVDENAQALAGGGTTNDNGKVFHQVRTRCGSLKCPPYENDKALACVVCLK